MSLELRLEGAGGHGSAPPRDNPITRLADAVARLRDHPFPARVRPPLDEMFSALAPEVSFGMRAVLANRWLFDPVLLRLMASEPGSSASVRTTTAVTMFRAGVKDNVLPSSASVVVNFRILPGQTQRDVLEHVREVIRDPDIELRTLPGAQPPSRVSDPKSPGFIAIRRAIEQVFPGAIVAPSLVIGATDTAHYADITDASFRFVPVRLGPGDGARYHGLNERIAVENYVECIQFYVQVLREGAG